MSMDRCWKCSRAVDTDYDLDCYRYAEPPHARWEDFKKDGFCICEPCREDLNIEED